MYCPLGRAGVRAFSPITVEKRAYRKLAERTKDHRGIGTGDDSGAIAGEDSLSHQQPTVPKRHSGRCRPLSLLTGFSPVCDESFIGRCSVGTQELFGSFMQLSERYWAYTQSNQEK